MQMNEAILVTSNEDGTKIVLNTRFFVNCYREKDDDYSTVVMCDELSDLEITETPEEFLALLTTPRFLTLGTSVQTTGYVQPLQVTPEPQLPQTFPEYQVISQGDPAQQTAPWEYHK